jgi:hypothetical protein
MAKKTISPEEVQNKKLLQEELPKTSREILSDINIVPEDIEESQIGQGFDYSEISPQILTDQYTEQDKDVISDLSRLNVTREDLDELRAEDQTFFGNVYRGGIRTVSKAIQEIIKAGGTIGGGIGWLASGADTQDTSLVFDNAFNRGVDNIFDQLVYENDAMGFKTFVPKRVREGSLADNLGSSAFWATEGADAVGFFASMFIPGKILASVGIGEKIAGLAGKLGSGRKLLSATEKLASLERLAGKIDNVLGIATNTIIESGAEASGVYQSVKNDLLAKGYDEEFANNLASDKAAKTFNTNLLLLAATNAQQWNFLGKSFNPKVSNQLLNTIEKQGGRLADIKALTKSPTLLKNVGKDLIKGSIMEGLVEEGGQSAIEKYFTNQGLELKEDEKGFVNSLKELGNDLAGITKTYGNNVFQDTEMDKAMFLGGLLGGLGGSVGAYREYQAAQDKYYGYEGRKTKLGKLFPREPRKGLKNIIEGSLITNYKTIGETLELDKNNKPIIDEEKGGFKRNPEKVKNLGKDKMKTIALARIAEDALIKGDKESFELYTNLIAFNEFKSEGLDTDESVEYLKESFIPNRGDQLIKSREEYKDLISGDKAEELSDENIAKMKQDLIKKVDTFKKIYDDVNERHNYESDVKYPLEKRNEYEDFMSRIKDVKLGERVNWAHADNRISELSERNNTLFNKNKFNKSSLNNIKEGNIIKYKGEIAEALGDNKFRKVEDNKEFEIKVAKETGKEIPVDIEKLDAIKPDVDEILNNYNSINFNKEVIAKAKDNLNAVYNNKELQKIFNNELKLNELVAKQVEFKDTFKPNTYWKDPFGNRFKLQYEGNKPVLYREQLDEGEYKYVQELPLTEQLLDPTTFKNNFSKADSPNPAENVEETESPVEEITTEETTEETPVTEEISETSTKPEEKTKPKILGPVNKKNLEDIEDLPKLDIKNVPEELRPPSVEEEVTSEGNKKNNINTSDTEEDKSTDKIDSNPEEFKNNKLEGNLDIDTSVDLLTKPSGLKRHPLNAFSTTANTKDQNLTDELNGDPNAFKADKVASDLPIYNGGYRLKAFKPSRVWKNMEGYFNEVAPDYSFEDTIYLALVDNDGNLVGVNENYTKLTKLSSNNLDDYDNQTNKDVIFWSLREATNKFKGSGLDVYFKPDVKADMDLLLNLFTSDQINAINESNNTKKNPDTGLTDRESLALNFFDQLMQDELDKHDKRRNTISQLINNGKDVTIKITGHSKGISSNIDETQYNVASKALSAVEGISEQELIDQVELKVADKEFIDFGNGNKIAAQLGRTYAYNEKSGHIYDLQPRKFNFNEQENIISLFNYYIDRLNQIYESKGDKLSPEDFTKAEEIYYNNKLGDKVQLTLDGNNISLFGYLGSIIHSNYIKPGRIDSKGRKINLSTKSKSGQKRNAEVDIVTFNDLTKKYVLNPEFINNTNSGLLQTELPNYYYQIRAVKTKNDKDNIFDLKGYDNANKVLKGSISNYKDFILRNVLQSDILPPISKELNKHSYFGGGIENVPMPTFNSVYINLDLTPFDNIVESPKTDAETNQEIINSKLNHLDEDITSFRLFRGNKNYIQEDFDSFKSWFNEVLPQFGEEGFKVINDLLEKGIFGKVKDYAITLDEAAEIGTGYHEAFHMVTHYLLSSKERANLYKEWRDRNPESKLSDKEIEEILAEDFREYKLSDGKFKYPPVKESLFKKILRYIKNIFRGSLDKTFARIDSGYYRLRNIRPNKESSNREPRFFVSDNPVQSSMEFYHEVMDATTVYFFDEIRKSEKSFASLFNKDNNKELINNTYKRIYELFQLERETVKDFINRIEYRLENEPSRQNELKLERANEQLEHYDFLLSQFETPEALDNFRKKHAQELREYGLADKFIDDESYESKEFNQDDILEQTGQTEITRDLVWNLSDLSIKFDAKYNAQKSIKLLVGTIPKLNYNKNTKKYERKYSKLLGVPKVVDFGGTFSTILNNLSGTKTVDETINILSGLVKDVPSLQYLFTEDGLNLNKLKEGNIDMPFSKFDEVIKFTQTFAKTNNNFSVSVLNEGGKRDFIDTNKQAQRRGIKTKWRSNSNLIILDPKNKVLNKEGIYNPSAFSNIKLNSNEPNTSFDFLEKLGINYTDRNKVLEQGYAGELWRISKYILDEILKGNQPNIFSSAEDTNFGKNLNQLIDFEYESNIDLNESSHLGPDGQSIYNHSLNSFISNVLDNINKFQGENAWDSMVNFYPHLDTRKITWIKNSILLKKGGLLFTESGERRRDTDLILHTAEAIRETENSTVDEYSKLSKEDRMADVIDRLIKGQYNLIRPADKSLERFFSIGNQAFQINTDNALSYFTGYLIDEVNTIREYRTNPNDRYWKNYNKNNDNEQGIFINIIREYSQAPTWTEETFNKFIKSNEPIDAFLSANKSKIEDAFKEYLNKQSNLLFKWLVNNRLIEKVGDKYISKAIQFSKDTNEFTIKNLGNRIKDVIIQDTVMNIEQLKTIFGNPNYYGKIADFFKRTGSFPGTKKLLVSDFLVDSFIEKNMKRTDRAEGLVDNTVGAKVYSTDDSRSRNKAIVKQMVFAEIEVEDDVFGKDIEETDGYSMVSLDEAREMLFRAGDWSWGENSLEDLYQYEMQRYYGKNLDKEDFLTTKEFNEIFNRNGWNGIVKNPEDSREITSKPTVKLNMLKPLYVGPYAELGFVPGISKTSFGIIYPSAVQGKPNLEKMMHFMRKNQIGVVSFASANKGITTKLNQEGELSKLYDNEGELILDKVMLDDIKISHKIPMNFEDGTGGRRMRSEFKGKSTLELIKEGNRTATSRDRSKSYNQQNIKVGDIIEFYANQGKSNGEKVLVRVTKAPYKLSEVTAEQWSRLEGWSQDRYNTLLNEGYEQFQFELIYPSVTQNTYYEFWGIQLDTGFKNKDKVIYGTQMMKQILSYIYADGKVKDDFSDISNEVEEYKRLNQERLDLGKQQLLEELDIQSKEITDDNGNTKTEYVIQDYTKFKDKLKNIANERGMDDNTYNSINFIEETLGMDILLNRNKFEAAIFSLNDALVIKQKRRGGAYYQQPSTLHESSGLREFNKKNGTLKSSTDLKAYNVEKDEDGKITKIGKMEIMLPNVFKGLSKDQLEDIVREGIAFRIPTQGLASIEAIEVVGFLDDSAGDTVVLPSSIVKKAGSDYDIDKLNIYLPYFYETKQGNGIYININESYENYSANVKGKKLSEREYRKAQVENRITKIQKDIILHPANYDNLTKSLDDTKEIITRLADEIYELRTGNKRNTEGLTSIVNRINLTNVADRFLSSKQAVGITALASPFHILAQIDDLKLAKYDSNGNENTINLPHNSDKNGNIILGGELDKNSSNIAEILRQWISEAVDAAKDPRMFDLNVNLETLNVVEYLSMAGVPTDHLLYFLNQPIIVDYLNLKSSGKAKFNDVNYKSLLDKNGNEIKNRITKEVVTRSETLTNKEIKDIILTKYGNKSSNKYDNSIEALKGNIGIIDGSDSFNANQIAILEDYLRYKNSADILTEAVQGASWDTNSAGKSIPELLMKLDSSRITINKKSYRPEEQPDGKIKKVDNGPLLINYDKLLTGENSFIRPYYENNKSLVEEFSPLFKVALGDPNIRTLLKHMTYRYSTEFSLTKDEQVAILNNFISGYITYNMITKSSNKNMYATQEEFDKAIEKQDHQIVKEFNRLFTGGNSVAKRLDSIQEVLLDFQAVIDNKMSTEALRKKYGYVEGTENDEYNRKVQFFNKYKDNVLLQALIPNISESSEYMDHVVLHNRKRDLLEVSQLVDSWNTILNDQDVRMKRFGLDLVKLLAMQTGIQNSPNNFMYIVPAEVYTSLVKQTMNDRFQGNEAAKRDAFKYYLEYHLDNNRNDNIVPGNRNLKNKSKAYPFTKGKTKIKEAFENKSDAEIRKLISQGKSVWEDNPSMQLRKDKKAGINQYLPAFYKLSKLSQELNIYGRVNLKLFNLLESEFAEIFARQAPGNVVEEKTSSENTQNTQEESYSNLKNNLKKYLDSNLYNSIFAQYNINSQLDIDNLNEEEVGEIVRKICNK